MFVDILIDLLKMSPHLPIYLNAGVFVTIKLVPLRVECSKHVDVDISYILKGLYMILLEDFGIDKMYIYTDDKVNELV